MSQSTSSGKSHELRPLARGSSAGLWTLASVAAGLAGLMGSASGAIGVLFAGAAAHASLRWKARRLAAVLEAAGLLALQLPLLVVIGVYLLQVPLGRAPDYLSIKGPADLACVAFATVGAVAMSELGLLLIEHDRLVGLVRKARLARPALILTSAALVLAGVLRSVEVPSVESYASSQPILATLPPMRTLTCAAPSPDDQEAASRNADCVSPIVSAGELELRFVCAPSTAQYCWLLHRTPDGREQQSGYISQDEPASVRSGPTADSWILVSTRATLLYRSGARPLFFSDLRGKASVPSGWLVVGAIGLFVALSARGLSLARRSLRPGWAVVADDLATAGALVSLVAAVPIAVAAATRLLW